MPRPSIPTVGETYDLAQQATTRSEFRREVLVRLQASIGFEGAFFHHVTPAPLDRSTVLGCPADMLPRSQGEYTRRYASSFQPVFEALKKTPIVVDSEMFGECALHQQSYYTDILLPIGFRQSIYALAGFRDRPPALLSMARQSVSPLCHDVREKLTSLLPVLALADVSLTACHETSEHGGAFTAKQQQLIGYVRRGLRNKEIAQLMGISPNTVRNRLVILFDLVGASSRTELLALTSAGDSGRA